MCLLSTSMFIGRLSGVYQTCRGTSLREALSSLISHLSTITPKQKNGSVSEIDTEPFFLVIEFFILQERG